VGEDVIDELRRIPGVATVTVDEHDQMQIVRVQSAAGLELTQTLLSRFNGARIGRVSAREPTLEDAYVEVVTEAAV
jgi:ABC-2 type transport system ATP-binding protein